MRALIFFIGFSLGAITIAAIIRSKPPQQIETIVYQDIDTNGQDIVGGLKIDGCDYLIIHSNNCPNPLHIEINDTIPENAKLYTKK